MSLAVQHLVDRLAARLNRPAVLEDRFFRLVAYSAHDEPVDSVRQMSIMRRHASPEVSRWLGDVGIREAQGPVRIPGNIGLDMLPRVCFPIRHRHVLLGYLCSSTPRSPCRPPKLTRASRVPTNWAF